MFFHLFVFAFDKKCFDILTKLNLEFVTVVSYNDFEDEELLSIKNTRSRIEYLWTCTPSIILYTFKSFNIESCTYLDADIYFYNSPEIIINEIYENSVLITGHNYTKKYDDTILSGKYCVQFLTFKNNEKGIKVLKHWRKSCIDWCYAKGENGKFGDQKYLDNWLENFEGVKVIKNLGAGVAPWNLQQYSYFYKNNKIFFNIKNLEEGNQVYPIIFFHFHGLTFYNNNTLKLTHHKYYIPKFIIEEIYIPYIKLLEDLKQKIIKIDNSFDPNGSTSPYFKENFNFNFLVHTYYYDLKKILIELSKALFFLNTIDKIRIFKSLLNKNKLLKINKDN
jgi:hypothetical protein